MPIVLGPILQFRGVADGRWCVAALVVCTHGSPPPVVASDASGFDPIRKLAAVPVSAPRYDLWQVVFACVRPAAGGRTVRYTIDDVAGAIDVPDAATSPRIACASCNGPADPALTQSVGDTFDRWQHIGIAHVKEPYHLLLLGSDRIPADGMWRAVQALLEWAEPALATPLLDQELDRCCAERHVRCKPPEFAAVLARVPAIMRRDEPAAVDGWAVCTAALVRPRAAIAVPQ